MKKKTAFIISLCIVLLIVVGSIILGRMITRQPNPAVTSATPSITPMDHPAVQYDVEKSRKMDAIFNNRPVLVQDDQQVRKNLTLKKNPLLINDVATVEYLSSPDEFMVEIRSTDIEGTKAKVVDWFMQQGMTKEGICNLPVVFYLNYDIAQSLRGTNTVFNPLPSHC